MIEMKDQIAARLHGQFDEMGFAAPGVEALREGADVSLRTLYKYFPSREAMVVGALEHRDRAYDDWIGTGPAEGADHVLHILVRLADWLSGISNAGCLFRNALSAYPDSAAIRAAVKAHKAGLRAKFQGRLAHVAPRCDADRLADQLFILHEGMTEAARLIGPAAARRQTLRTARLILTAADIA
ncbi:TetR/AcrR family transcriptional regulator [Aliiroseovarius sp.]|uniref:TetR/AcrR family transcriptional regulator n=1 Tax=Aliiroseovarius sp. TaxID=1872442 RepID=UPI00261104DD|nr:TetR/AcrR family transcriptional regulator [Aliiroseovarius sp.]